MPVHGCILFTKQNIQITQHLSGGGLLQEAFAHDAEGLTQAKHFFSQLKTPIFDLILDVAEEDFQFDVQPKVSARLQRRICARKSEQFFRATPYRLSQPCAPVQKNAAGRREQAYLFSALLNPDLLNRWLALFDEMHIAVRSAQSVPYLLADCVAKIGMIPTQALWIFVDEKGIRQVFLQGRYLRFSRLLQFPQKATVEDVRQETQKCLQYLKTSKQLQGSTEVELIFVAALERMFSLQQELAKSDFVAWSTAEIVIQYMDFKQLLQSIVSPEYVSHFSQDIDLSLIWCLVVMWQARQASHSNYLPATTTRLYLILCWRRWLLWGGVFFSLLLVLTCVVYWQQLEKQRYLYTQQSNNIQTIQSNLVQVQGVLAAIHADTQSVLPVVTYYQQNLANAPQPPDLLSGLQQAMATVQGVSIRRIDWLATRYAVPSTQLTLFNPSEQHANARPASATPLPNSAAFEVEGELDARFSPREALLTIRQLQNNLHQQAALKAYVIQVRALPLNLHQSARLQEGAMSNHFVLRVQPSAWQSVSHSNPEDTP